MKKINGSYSLVLLNFLLQRGGIHKEANVFIHVITLHILLCVKRKRCCDNTPKQQITLLHYSYNNSCYSRYFPNLQPSSFLQLVDVFQTWRDIFHNLVQCTEEMDCVNTEFKGTHNLHVTYQAMWNLFSAFDPSHGGAVNSTRSTLWNHLLI